MKKCINCGDEQLSEGHWAGKSDCESGSSEPVQGGLSMCGDLHRWAEPKAWIVPGSPGTFPTFAEAEQWRSAQIWDGGIGMTPMPEPVY